MKFERTTILLRDYSPVPEAYETICQKIQDQIDNGSARVVTLNRKDSATEPPKLFVTHENALWTQQYIGQLEYQDGKNRHLLQIGSRFDKNKRPYFLWSLMMTYLGYDQSPGETLFFQSETAGTQGSDSYYAPLVFLFAAQLHQAWKKGSLRAYRSFAHNDSHPRGVIDIPRHLRLNAGRDNGCVAYRTRLYDLNNDWSVLFLQAAEVARQKCPQLYVHFGQCFPESQAALTALKQAVPAWMSVHPRQVLARTQQEIYNPIYRCYESVRSTARSLLKLGASPECGDNSRTVAGTFFDITAFWETFLQTKLFQNTTALKSQVTFPLISERQTTLVPIRPDFIFPSHKIVLDAKYRDIWQKTLNLHDLWGRHLDMKPIRENLYQVLSYMLALNYSDGGVIFPVSKQETTPLAPSCHFIGKTGLHFWRIPVYIPSQARDYKNFGALLDEELNRLQRCAPVELLLR